jgi:prepilin-type N-terminal cleavage/methylation domain-containing protein
MTSRKVRGFSLLELMIVIAIGLTMASVTFISLMTLFKKNHVDVAYDQTLGVIRTYRNLAITQGNRYILTATAPGTLKVQFWGYAPPPAASPAPVTVATYVLPQDIQFAVQTNFPNPGPDSIGTGATPIAFNACAVVASGNPCFIFYPDGSSQDDLGNFNTGVLYLTRPGEIYSSRAIDIYGTTGRVRGWRLYSSGASYMWTQQ